MNKKHLILGSFLIVLTSLGIYVKANGNTENGQTGFVLEGKVNKGANQLVVLQKLQEEGLVFLDSTRTDDKGRYHFSHPIDSAQFFYVTVNSMQPPGVPVVLKNDSKITLDLNIESFIKTAVKGDVHNLELKKLYDIYLNHNILTTDFDNRTRDINPINISDSLRNALNGEVYAMQTNFTNEVQNFVNTTTSDAAIYFASLYVIPNAGCESLNNSVNQAKKHAAEGVFTKKLAAYSSNSCMLEIGGEAPDIQLASPTGETVSLYSLRGKVVLIDFWASWCGPCRRENPNVVKLYNEYKEKGFEIYSVSLDQDASRWQAAIAQDKLTWTHVSDLRGWKSSAAALYRVTGIPQTYLLDKNGIIIGKGLRGAELEQKLSEIFN